MAKAPAREADHWHKLDHTANLFPVIASRRSTNVYRLSMNLDEPVVPELLQKALERALPWFAAFRVRLRRGFFWYYLEHNEETPQIHEEDDYPCRYIDPAQNNHFLFRVTYFEARVNLEVFHVLTDGTGGYEFLKAILCQYLMLAHPAAFSDVAKTTHWFAGHAADTEDSYIANYAPTKKATYREGRAYHLKGEQFYLGNMSVAHAHIALDGLLALCREKGVSVSQYLVAVMGWAVYNDMRGNHSKYPVNIFIPVNLRNMFESSTSLNFFSNIYVSLPCDKPGLVFEDFLAQSKAQFEQKVNRQYMAERLSYIVGSGYSPWIRPVPLPLKILALRAIYEASASSSTMGFSNVGKLDMPDSFAPYIRGASLMLSSTPREPFKCTAISWGKTLTFTMASTLRDFHLQRAIARYLAADGLDVTIETNGVDYGSM